MSNYTILGLKKGATIPEIKKKFRELCMIHHPDKGGNTATFVKIKEAYEALLEGNSGEQQQQSRRYQEDQQARDEWERARVRVGQFRFVEIKKDYHGYLITFFFKDIKRVLIYGKNGMRIGNYDVRSVNGYTNIVVDYEQAILAEYFFKIRIEGYDDDSATVTYKVKPPFKPTWWQKILIKFGKKYE